MLLVAASVRVAVPAEDASKELHFVRVQVSAEEMSESTEICRLHCLHPLISSPSPSPSSQSDTEPSGRCVSLSLWRTILYVPVAEEANPT